MLAEHLFGNVKFKYYRDGKLFYQADSGLIFPVPIEDTGKMTFLDKDRASFFMNYIAKHLETIRSGAV